jgi:hypothetical protein
MIKSAACRLDDGTIFEGKDHSACIKQMPVKCLKNMQGFVTSEGKFVDRIEAGKIAFLAGQIKDDPKGSIILSEEIWHDGNCVWDEKACCYKLKEA